MTLSSFCAGSSLFERMAFDGDAEPETTRQPLVSVRPCRAIVCRNGLARLYSHPSMFFAWTRPLEFRTVMTFTVMGIPRAPLFERVAESAESQSLLDHCRHLGIEVYPDYGRACCKTHAVLCLKSFPISLSGTR
jgi:hypothetical protein